MLSKCLTFYLCNKMENLQVKVTLMKDGKNILEVCERTLQDAANDDG